MYVLCLVANLGLMFVFGLIADLELTVDLGLIFNCWFFIVP
jgi:hypothetical protein